MSFGPTAPRATNRLVIAELDEGGELALGMQARMRLPIFAAVLATVGSGLAGNTPGRGSAGRARQVRIEIEKGDRLLQLIVDGEVVRKYRVGLGFEPVAPKSREGDGATPEGVYRVCVKNPRSRFLLSLGLSYPSIDDADRGLAAGIIDERDYARIVAAQQRGRRPPWDTPLGGEIYIHGRGSSTDWTLGCIALDDEDMRELYARVPVGTEVIIRP